MQGMFIREANIEDSAAIADFFDRCEGNYEVVFGGNSSTTLSRLNDIGLSRGKRAFIAIDNDDPSVVRGYLDLFERDNAVEFTNLEVEKTHQGLGVGSALIRHAAAFADNLDKGQYCTIAMRLLPLYAQFGFVQSGTLLGGQDDGIEVERASYTLPKILTPCCRPAGR